MAAGLDTSLRARLLAVSAGIGAVAACWASHPWLGDVPILVLLPAAATLAVWLAGPVFAALVATTGYLAADLLFLHGAGIGPRSSDGWTILIICAIYSAGLIVLGEATWRSRFRTGNADEVDVAERRRAAEARASLAAIVAASDDAIISKDLNGVIRSWNPGAERLFGYSADESIGQSINLIIPAELRDEEQRIMERLRQGERVEHFDTVRLTRSARRLHISLSISPIRDEHGETVGFSKIARDITERKRAEAAIRFSEERFRELADHIDQFAWTCDERGNATWYNRRWYDYTGASVDEMRDGRWRRFHDPALLDGVLARFQKCIASGEPWEDTFPLRGRDGSYRWFLSRAIPIRDDDGQVVRWFGTNTDVTEQRHLEQELVAADRRKDEFLATLAHELRNPLAPIRNALALLDRSGGDVGLGNRARDIIDRQVSHMVRLVDDLLDVSRITRDRLELYPVPVELKAIVEQALEVQRPQIDEKNLTVGLVLPPHPMNLQGDPVRLAQIVSNLLSNAVRYTGNGGRIDISLEDQGRQILLRVADDGVGIPPEQLDSIFEMFTQVDGSGQQSQSGLGVGLTLVRRLTELHGGRVEARSAGSGRGSEFLVRLPATQPAPTAAAPHEDGNRVHGGSSRRVLVVEDNPDTAATLATLLEIAGHDARVASDGAAGVELAEAFRPEVVLLDLGLPKMDGIEVCRWLRRQPWGESLTVVALTGWGQETDRRRTMEAGFDEHLVKPVGPDTVLGLVAATSRPSATKALS